MDSLAVIINNKAKQAHHAQPYLDAFSQHRIPVKVYYTAPEKLNDCLQSCQQQHPIILVGGGDGTIRSAAQYYANSSSILGVLPLGTMNHFVKEVSLPSSPDELIEGILQKKTKIIDLAVVNQHVFINNSSIGFYPKLVKKRIYYTKFYSKWLSYIPGFIQTLKKHQTYSLIIKSKDYSHTVNTSFLMISNNMYSFQFPISFRRENLNDELLGLYVFLHGKMQLSKLINYFFNRQENFAIHSSKYPIEIHTPYDKELIISLDGEITTVSTPLIYRTLPKSLTLVVKDL